MNIEQWESFVCFCLKKKEIVLFGFIFVAFNIKYIPVQKSIIIIIKDLNVHILNLEE